jgi:hypothetical protein
MNKDEVLKLIEKSHKKEINYVGIVEYNGDFKFVVEKVVGYRLTNFVEVATEFKTIKHLKEVAPDAKIFTIIRRKELKNYE